MIGDSVASNSPPLINAKVKVAEAACCHQMCEHRARTVSGVTKLRASHRARFHPFGARDRASRSILEAYCPESYNIGQQHERKLQCPKGRKERGRTASSSAVGSRVISPSGSTASAVAETTHRIATPASIRARHAALTAHARYLQPWTVESERPS